MTASTSSPPDAGTPDRRLDIGALSGIFALAGAAAAAAGQWLRQVVNPGAEPSLELTAAVLATTLLTVIAAAVATALIARIFTVAGGFSGGFWPGMAILLQDYSLHLAVWAVIWGIPFGTAMVIGAALSERIGRFLAISTGLAFGIAILLFFRRALSKISGRSWRDSGPRRESATFG